MSERGLQLPGTKNLFNGVNLLSERQSDTNKQNGLMTWIEPEVTALDVRETALTPGAGGDGQKKYADCTRS